MFSAQRQHPVAAVTKVLEIIKGNFISLLLLLFVTSGESMISLFGILSVMAVLLGSGVLSWLRFTYSIVDGELRIEQGIFVRKNIYLSKERIQVIDIKAGILQRLFGLVEVEVKTAGSSSKQAKISAISREKAEQLKNELRTETEQEADTVELEEELQNYKLSAKDLFITSCTSGSFGIALSIVGTAFSQIDQVLSEEQLLYYLETLIPAS
ncbi:MAG: PH domain-containing protein, partial [Candidatus Halalkalibacterium sp. M3_1C_030]